MPWEQLALYALTMIAALGGWILKTLWDAVAHLRTDLSRLREEIGKNYMPRDEIRDLFKRILDELRDMRNEIYAHEKEEMELLRKKRNGE